MNPFSTKGTWTIPGNPHSLGGELFFNAKEGAFLRTHSLFQGVVYGMFTEIPIIHGIVAGKEKYTLLNCFVHAHRGPETGFRAGLIIQGYHLDNKEELIAAGIKFKTSALNGWLLSSGLSYSTQDDRHGLDVKYNRPDPFVFSVANEMNGEIGFTEQIETGKYSAIIQQDCYIQLGFKNSALPYLKALDQFTTFYQFLTFALQQAPDIKEISLSMSETLDNPENPKLWMSVFFQNRPAASENADSISSRFLFYRPEIADFSFSITKWFEMDQLAGPSLKLLFDTYLNAAFDENTFLNQCQAIESFHRRLYPTDGVLAEAHEKKLQAIYEKITDQTHLRWLQDVLKHSGEPSLRKRLKAMLKELESFQIIKELPFDSKLIDLIVANRNHYTHYSGDDKIILSETALAKLTAKLKIIFTVLLLKHLEFSIEHIDHFHTSGRFLNFYFATR